jgi:ABC-type sugar transport system ATPase subunit
LKSVGFHSKRREIVGLVDENGAGKSTLMKIFYRAYQHVGGKILLNGTEVHFANPREALDIGIGFQK